MKAFKKFTALFLALLMIVSTGAALTFNTAADTATEDWYKEEGILEVGSYDDLLKFAAASNADNSYLAGRTVKLTTDIDMTGKTWTPIYRFDGNLDGGGNVIDGLTVEAANKAAFIARLGGEVTIENIAFTNANITCTASSGASMQAIVAAIINGGVNTTITFRNVYAEGTVSSNGGYGASAFLAQAYIANSYTCAVSFENCVSNVTISGSAQRNGGFVGLANSSNVSLSFTDCAVIGGHIIGSYSGGFVGYSNAHLSFTRCVFAGKMNSLSNGGLFFSELKAAERVINFTDCYVATQTVSDTYKTNLLWAQNSTGYVAYADVNVKYGSADAVKVASKTEALGAKVADIVTLFENNGAYLANGDTVTLTADNFGKICPALAKAGWVVTDKTVEYADGKTIVKILPAYVATMIGETALTSPTGAKSLQVRDNGTSYDVRIVGTVNFTDPTAYDYVGFEYSVKVKGADSAFITDSWETSKVFTSILADSETVKATDEGINAAAFNLIEFCGFADGDTYEITVLSYAKKGEVITYNYAGAFTVTVQNGAVVQ